MIYGFIARLLIESSLEILVSSFLNISYPVTNTYGQWISLICSYGLALLQCVLALCILIYFSKNFGKMDEPHIKVRWRMVTEEINTHRYSANYFFPFFILRRTIFVLSATYLDTHDVLQLMIFMVTNLLYMLYIAVCRPLDSPVRNNLEIFNESCIMVMTGSLFAYTLYVDDAEAKYNAGWFFIGVFLCNFGVNSAVLSREMFE